MGTSNRFHDRLTSTLTDKRLPARAKKYLEENNIEFVYQPKMFGKPDFLIQRKIVIFCGSSFWHGRNWSKLKHQLSKEYWIKHIMQNKRRDKMVNRNLRENNYIVLRFWDDQIEKRINKCIDKIKKNVQIAEKQAMVPHE